jgi:hypothetical protein
MELVYIDSSAATKLFKAEAETEPLKLWAAQQLPARPPDHQPPHLDRGDAEPPCRRD